MIEKEIINRERQHEDWIEDISKGIGNTKRISIVWSNKQFIFIELLQEEAYHLQNHLIHHYYTHNDHVHIHNDHP